MHRLSHEDPTKGIRQAMQTALNILAHRDHAVSEIRVKLQKKDIEQPVIDEVIQKLLSLDYLNDERFAEHYVRVKKEKGLGPLRILYELRQRNITANLIDQYLPMDEDYWAEPLAQQWTKRFGKLPTDFRQKAKQLRFLQYRGFSMDQIRHFFQDMETTS
jgi:regulatory protein